jgi:hypothetical protein
VKRDGENMTHGESVQPLQSVKLVYQPCSQSRAGLDFFKISGSWWLRMGSSLGKGMVGRLGWDLSVGSDGS